MYTFTYNYETKLPLICDDGHGDYRKDFCMYSYCNQCIDNSTFLFDDGHGDYNRSYDRGYDDFDYADYSTDHRDNNFRNYEKKRRKTNKEIIEDLLKRWD